MAAIRKSAGDRVFDVCNYCLLILLSIIFLYPMLHVLFASLSDPARLISHRGILLYPKGFTLTGYGIVFKDRNTLLGYANTLFYMVVGTGLNLLLTSMGAYVLSRKSFMLKKAMSVMLVVTMYFSGGLIPNFLLVKSLGMYDNRLALILPTAISAYNLIVMRTAFSQLPDGLEESAKIDGANDFTILFRIVLPVSMSVVAVMVLFYAVGHWNGWFNAYIYLRTRTKYPLALFLRETLIENRISADMEFTDSAESFFTKALIKYCTIIVSTVPILVIYPFLQKYFAKGVMVGSLKG